MLIEKKFNQMKKPLVRKNVLYNLYWIPGLVPQQTTRKELCGSEPVSEHWALAGIQRKAMTTLLQVYTWYFEYQRKSELIPIEMSSNHWRTVKPCKVPVMMSPSLSHRKRERDIPGNSHIPKNSFIHSFTNSFIPHTLTTCLPCARHCGRCHKSS